ncbi:NLGN [Lepeophtheirus salmonis]|uniref:NLGN n=1 Tax=Lepeophtheirus salmonis TaxID=72036 RepID=A0A7R8CJQ1_LEPSM|nr:NLGN [Lepeophtheirus salmonis]CAF2843370.1 NLGN [Lepeophtheirus salmonis]
MLVLLLIAACLTSAQRPTRTVETKHGRIKGTLLDIPSEGGEGLRVEVYKGIPFAAPPMGSLRFMPPVTVSPWRNIRSATEFGPVCPQLLPDVRNESTARAHMVEGRVRNIKRVLPLLRNQSEDCLYLNVYASISGPSQLKPVLLFIHGDSYNWGSGNLYDASVLAAYGKVVVVTLNYRLGILGFLNPNTDGRSNHPSNLGILDQIAALHWVQENIESFGGDRSSVTLMGHGTGAACVHFLMTSEALPEGMLFQRVILMSGSALSPWAVSRDPARSTLRIASSLNCSADAQDSPQNLLSCLRSVPLYKLMRVQVPQTSPFRPVWGPSYDGVVVHSFRHRMRDYLEKMARYELLFSVATADALFALNHKQLEYGMETESRNILLSKYVSANYELHQERDFFSHRYGLHRLAESITSPKTGDYHSSLNTRSWFSVFEYQTKTSNYKQRLGCAHGEELSYVFGTPLRLNPMGSGENEALKYSNQEIQLSKFIMKYFSNFATSGDPNKNDGMLKDDRLALPKWDRYDPKYKKYLQLGLKPRMRDHYRSQKMALWLNLIPDLQAAAADAEERRRSFEHNMKAVYQSEEEFLGYRLYSELLPFVPNLKNVEGVRTESSTPASSEVLDPSRTNTTVMTHRESNVTSYVLQKQNAPTFHSYSTALTVYYQRDRHRDSRSRRCKSLGDSSSSNSSSSSGGPQNNNIVLGNKPSMSSISQYIERGSDEALGVNYRSNSSRRSSGNSIQTYNITHPGRIMKSVLKTAPGQHRSSVRTHRPPPEFADVPSPPPPVTSNAEMSSFRTLPRNQTFSGGGGGVSESGGAHIFRVDSLKKTSNNPCSNTGGSGNNGITENSWNLGSVGTRNPSMEELRV